VIDVRTDGDALSYEAIGDPELPVVAMLHGMLSSNRQWAPNIDPLSRHFRLVLIETWGHGKSPTPTDPNAYHVDGIIDAVDVVRRAVGAETWSLIGYSHGGAVALQYALRRPEHTDRVVFTNSRASMAIGAPQEGIRNASRILRPGAIQNLPFHPKNATRLPKDLHGALVDAADGVSVEAVSGLMRNAWQLSARSRLAELEVPVTLINGRFERSFQPAVDEIRRIAPQIDVFDVEAGHAVNMQAVDAFNEIAIRALGAS
jgi:2-succinyl-6-hydroxy-2,4-cyclohexadiene-1-carboxylate synthase